MLPMNTVMEKFTDNLMIPVGAFFFCIFTGWVWGIGKAEAEIEAEGSCRFGLKRLWGAIVKFVAPAFILVILYFTVGKGQGLS